MILMPRLSMSPCENILMPSSVRTMTLVPEACITVPFFTSVTVTGVTVVFVVIVAVPAMPGFSSCTDSIFPSTLNRKSCGHGQFPGAFGQLDDELVAIHRDDLELLGFLTSLSSAPTRRRPSGTRAHHTTPPESLHAS